MKFKPVLVPKCTTVIKLLREFEKNWKVAGKLEKDFELKIFI